jgi:hypothetical protein
VIWSGSVFDMEVVVKEEVDEEDGVGGVCVQPLR